MTVLENLLLAPLQQAGERFWNNWVRAGRVRREERLARERALEALELCDLADKAGELAGRLSGGQQKLLELARVLVADPSLILLDEPAAGVNPALLETLVDRIVRLNRRGVTFLVIEHNIDLVLAVCRPVVVMAQGRLIYHGDAAGVRADRRVLDAYLGDVPA
jgi:ABC-type branched-subunit amino acid transport system ATPase component